MGEIILEIIKYTIPGLIVLAASYLILKQYMQGQYQLKALELQAKYSKDAIPLKLQAYERLLLLCDRIHMPNLILRLKTKDMNAVELKNSMIISIQKEYEHNMAQQLYTSQNLWDILTLSKNDLISMVNKIGDAYDKTVDADTLAHALLSEYGSLQKSPLNYAIAAIKEEAKIILNV